MRLSQVADKMSDGLPIEFRPHGNSMTPIIKSGDLVQIMPPIHCAGRPRKGDVVLAKIKGRFVLHKITAMQGPRVQIGNNHGLINGWTLYRNIYGYVTRVNGKLLN